MGSERKTLVVVFGGVDRTRLETYGCSNLRQTEFGPVDISRIEPREPSLVMASLITGSYPEEHGVTSEYVIENRLVRWAYEVMRSRSETTRRTAGSLVDVKKRRPIAADLTVPTIFDEIADSVPLFIPGFNPEIGWCLDRNVLNPNEFPELGIEAAEELLAKNFEWRRKHCLEALEAETSFVMCHFQKVDSIQHLYYKYTDDDGRIRRVYEEMDEFAASLKRQAEESGFTRIDFMSEHGLPRDDALKHEDNAFYSSNVELGLDRPEIVHFHDTYLC